MFKLKLLRLTVFLAAFLLFSIEIIMSKALLPGFGGSYLVWAACVLFFQTALLAGYAYASFAARRFSVKFFGPAQIVILLLALPFFPLRLENLEPASNFSFLSEILLILLRNIGPPFFALATVSVMAQNVLASANRSESENPYFLYGTSNLGSFIALLTYPFLVEPFLDLGVQLTIWQAAFAALCLIQAAAIVMLLKGRPDKSVGPAMSHFEGDTTAERDTLVAPADRPDKSVSLPSPDKSVGPTGRDALGWFLFSAAGSAMFLAVTNLITFELAAIPLLLILPLSVFLLTFYLCFKQKPWRPAFISNRLSFALLLGLYLFLLAILGYVFPMIIMLSAHLLILFVFCMFCQNALAEDKPADPRRLGAFYLTLAAGGVAGSALVSFAVPLLATDLIEYPLGFLIAYAAALITRRAEPQWSLRDAAGLAAAGPFVLWPLSMSLFGDEVSHLLAAGYGIMLALIFFLISRRVRSVVAALVTVIALVPFLDSFQAGSSLVFKRRNFYGIYRVYDKDGKRFLRHGSTIHGAQYLDSARASVPIMYYHPTAPAAELLASGLYPFRKIAVVGLGTGSAAAYLRPGQRMDYYELDPDNLPVANNYFSYLKESQGLVRYVFGDARLALRRAEAERYDLIMVDAFNSDSIPIHLLTVEAIAGYFDRLTPDGILLLHISNRYLDLLPMLYQNSRELDLHAYYKINIAFKDPDAELSEWMVMTRDRLTARPLVQKLQWTDLRLDPPRIAAKPWTDRFSNPLAALMAKE